MTEQIQVNIQHGTLTGYKLCCKRSQGACDPCREVNRSSTRRFRADNPAFKAKQALRNRVRNRALVALAERHPEEFAELLSAQYAREREATAMTFD